jgi:hypothetical protein
MEANKKLTEALKDYFTEILIEHGADADRTVIAEAITQIYWSGKEAIVQLGEEMGFSREEVLNEWPGDLDEKVKRLAV